MSNEPHNPGCTPRASPGSPGLAWTGPDLASSWCLALGCLQPVCLSLWAVRETLEQTSKCQLAYQELVADYQYLPLLGLAISHFRQCFFREDHKKNILVSSVLHSPYSIMLLMSPEQVGMSWKCSRRVMDYVSPEQWTESSLEVPEIWSQWGFKQRDGVSELCRSLGPIATTPWGKTGLRWAWEVGPPGVSIGLAVGVWWGHKTQGPRTTTLQDLEREQPPTQLVPPHRRGATRSSKGREFISYLPKKSVCTK